MAIDNVFAEQSFAVRRVEHIKPQEKPLPNNSTHQQRPLACETYDVVIVGGGPAGLMLNLLLIRYGIAPKSCLCVEADVTLSGGRADGIFQRTLEVFQSLGLAHEIVDHGSHIYEYAKWARDDDAPEQGIKRKLITKVEMARSRFKQGFTAISQYRTQLILEQDMTNYGGNDVERGCRLVNVRIIEDDHLTDYPVEATLTHGGQTRTIRAKYLVGADGSRSKVRECMKIPMKGSMTEDIWGVMDVVFDTDFPDIRRDCHTQSQNRIITSIPREKVSNGDYLTRVYVPIISNIPAPDRQTQSLVNGSANQSQEDEKKLEAHIREEQRALRATITPKSILDRISEAFQPYSMKPKNSNSIYWWAAYQIGQRVADRMMQRDSTGHGRVFIIGDAAHTHSPSIGQGLNVSMLDGYDLAWKLAYVLHNLTPDPEALLDTFDRDRTKNSRDLIETDRLVYSTEYSNQEDKRLSQMEHVSGPGMVGFLSGVGVEYDEGWLVDPKCASEKGLLTSNDWDGGALREGRSIRDVMVERFADGVVWHLQDSFASDGRFKVVVFTSQDLLQPDGRSAQALEQVCGSLIDSFIADTIKIVALTCLEPWSFQWKGVPASLKTVAEMTFYHGHSEAYGVYAVSEERGVMCVVRPDGYIGTIAALDDTHKVEEYLARCVLRVCKAA